MRRGGWETLAAALGLLVLVSVLVAFDARVRDRVETIVVGNNAGMTIASVSAAARQVGGALVDSASEQSREHIPLLIFAAVAAALTIIMLRT